MRRIGILGHFGTENLGDEAVIAGVLHQIRNLYPDAEIIAFTGHPDDARRRHGIASFPLWRHARTSGSGVAQPTKRRVTAALRDVAKRIPGLPAVLKTIRTAGRLPGVLLQELRFLAQCRRRLQQVDLLIIAGSNQLNDYWGGAWDFPYTLLKWCLLAKSVGAKVAFLCCGAGPLRSWLGKRFIQYSLSLADYRSYRDVGSQRLVTSIGAPGDDPVCTDLAWGLELTPAVPQETSSRLVVGLNPLPYFDPRYWPEPDPGRYHDYVRKLVTFAAWLSARGHRLRFFPTQLRADPSVIEDIRALLRDNGAIVDDDPFARSPMRSLEDLMLRLATMDIVVATRYHGVLLAAAVHRPVLAIAYYRKTVDLMAQIGQSDYVVDITSFDATALATRFERMESSVQAISRDIGQRALGLRQGVVNECDRVFGLVEHPSDIGARPEQAPVLAG